MNNDLNDSEEQDEADQIIEFALFIGIDPENEPYLMDLAQEGLQAQTPKHWVHGEDSEGNEFYYNKNTNEYLTDEHPNLEIYRQKVAEERHNRKF